MKNPFEMAPYRKNLTAQERFDIEKRKYTERFRHILASLDKPEDMAGLSNEDHGFADIVWSSIELVEHPEVYSSWDEPRINDMNELALNLGISKEETEQFIHAFNSKELLAFKEKWRPQY